MVARSIFVTDSDALVVTSSSSAGLVGNGIINNSSTPDGTIFNFSSSFGATVTLDDAGAFADAIPEDNNLFFNDDEAADHVITDGAGLIANGTTVEAESTINIRALDANGDPTGPVIELTVFSQGGDFSDVWGFASDAPLVDGVSYIKVSGDNDGTTLYTDFIACFDADTRIATQTGAMRAADLAVGDMVWTRNEGYQPIRWFGSSNIKAEGVLAPIVFAPGVIGNETELVVSPEHRVLLNDVQAEILFGSREVLLAAKHLIGLPGVSRREGGMICYVHFMFDRHQIVRANGADCESFYLSKHAVSGVEADQRKELLALFPDLATGIDAFGGGALTMLKGYEARLLCKQIARQTRPS